MTKTPAERQSVRHRYIDAMRGIAALSVVYFHIANHAIRSSAALSTTETLVYYTTTNIIDTAKIAVVVFFIISGYVIPFSLLKARDNNRTIFIIGRFFRLYPAYWLSVFLSAIFLFYLRGIGLPLKELVANITMLQGFVFIPDMNGVYWTLQIELIFYAVCIILYTLNVLQRVSYVFTASLLFLLAAIAAALARHFTALPIPVAIPLSLSVMFFGMMWRIREQESTPLTVDQNKMRGMLKIYILVYFLIMPAICFSGYSSEGRSILEATKYIITYYASITIFIIFTTVIKSRSAILSYFGKISFSIYLFGPIVDAAVISLFNHILGFRLVPMWEILVVVPTTIAFSAITYWLVERPSITLGKHVASRFAGRKNIATQSAFEAPL